MSEGFRSIRDKESYTVLSVDPLSKVGLKLTKKIGKTKYYEAIQVIYVQNNIANLSLEKTLAADQNIIGYVRYIFTDSIKNYSNCKEKPN